MIMKDSIEAAYSFFHQKWRVYEHSNMDWQKDDIEYAIDSYVTGMNPELYALISAGNNGFLHDHTAFAHDMQAALDTLEKML